MHSLEGYKKQNNTNTPIPFEKHVIVYSLDHLTNYQNTISFLEVHSPSQLKYSRKFIYDNEKYFNLSDIHIEIDFDLLGVTEYNIFFDVMNHIKENILCQKKIFYVVCLHFNNVKKELNEIIYTFLNINKLYFIFQTDNPSFINNNITNNSVLIKIVKSNTEYVTNQTSREGLENKLINYITTNNDISIFELREVLYSLLVRNYKIHDCFSSIIKKLIGILYINDKNIDIVMKRYIHILEHYNNNYRTIYHLELFILFLINLKNNNK